MKRYLWLPVNISLQMDLKMTPCNAELSTWLEKEERKEPPVNISSKPDATKAQFNAESNQSPNKRKRNRNKRKRVCVNNIDNGCQEVMPLTKTIPLERGIIASSVDVRTQAGSEKVQPSRLSRSQKKRNRKKLKKMLNDLKNNDKNDILLEGTALLKNISPINACLTMDMEIAQSNSEASLFQEKNEGKKQNMTHNTSENNDTEHVLQEGAGVPSLNVPNEDLEKEDVISVSGVSESTNMRENSSPSEKKKNKRNRKHRKKMDNTLMHNEEQSMMHNTLMHNEEQSMMHNTLKNNDNKKKRKHRKKVDNTLMHNEEQSMMNNALKNNDTDHVLQEGAGVPSLGAVTVKDFEKGNLISVSEVTQLGTTNIKENSLLSERNSGSPTSSNTCSMKKHDDHVEIDLVSQKSKIKIYKRKKKVESYYSESIKSPDSLRYCLEPIKDDGVRGTSFNCLDEAHVAVFSENKLEKVLVGVHAPSMQVTEDISMEEASVNCSDGDPVAHERKKRMEIKNLKETVLDIQDEHVEQKNGAELNKTQVTIGEKFHVDEDCDESETYCKEETSDDRSGCDPSCEHLDQKNAEMETKTGEIMTSLSNLCVVKDDVVEDVSHSLLEKGLIGWSKKKLLILDVNGLLADIVPDLPYVSAKYKPDIKISKKAVYKRPFVDDFLQFCFERFDLGVWSSRTKKNVGIIVDFLMGDSRKKLLFCWDQSHCTTTGVKTIENKNKPLVLKELKKLWEKREPNLPWEKGEYNESNTLLLDDSPYKALRNPAHTAIFPNTYQFRDAKDNSLGPGGDLRVYLEGLAVADNVQKYVEQNPFGQRAISESNTSWCFYRRIIATDSYSGGR